MKNFRVICEIMVALSVLLGAAFTYGVLNNKVESNSIEIGRVEKKHDADMTDVKINLANIHQLQMDMNRAIGEQTVLLKQYIK